MINKKNIGVIFPLMFAVIPLASCNSAPSFEAKNVKFYFDSLTPSEQRLYFSQSYSGIPYIDLNDGVKLCDKIYKDNDRNASFSIEKNENEFKLIRENGAYITFNFRHNYVTSKDINKFRANSFARTSMDVRGYEDSFFNEKGEKIKDQVRFLTTKSDNQIFETKPKTTDILLDAYNIKTYKQGDRYLVPFTTFYNIVTKCYLGCAFNGEDLFFTSDIGKYKELYYSFPKQNRSKELKEYNYYEFCRDLDYSYGLQDEHGISNFNTFFVNNGLKDLLLSDNRLDEDYVYYALQTCYLADFHTGLRFKNAYGGPDDDQSETNEIFKKLKIPPEYKQMIYKGKYRSNARKKYNNINNNSVIMPVFQNGDTLFITFDGFTSPDIDKYYTDEYKAHKDESMKAGDTCSIISYANDLIREDLDKSNPEIKNVVIDLSGNTGGAADTAMFVLGWLDSSVMQLVDPINESNSAVAYAADINFDKKIDGNDFLLFSNPNDKKAWEDLGHKTFAGKVYCLTSESSFSCGNYVPAMLKQSELAKIVGTKSGGGACMVHAGCTADGTGFSSSSNLKLCTRKNGSFYSIDNGIEPDYYLNDYETLYGGDTTLGYSNRDNIKTYISGLK